MYYLLEYRLEGSILKRIQAREPVSCLVPSEPVHKLVEIDLTVFVSV